MDIRSSKYLKIAIVYNLFRTITDINIYIESELFKVKVPLIFLGIISFSVYRDRYYLVILSSYFIKLIISNRVT